MRRWLSKLGMAALAAALALAWASAARADRIRTQRGIGYDGKIAGLDAEGILIDSGGARKSVPLADIARVEADAYPSLSVAEEKYAQGVAGRPRSFVEAEQVYRSILRGGASLPQWLRILIHSRIYKLYVDAGRTGEALDAYLDLARSQPAFAAGLKLPAPSAEAHEANRAMLKKVEDALALAGDKPYVGELKNFKVGLLMLEGTPEEVLPLLEPLLASPDEKTRQGAVLRQVELLVGAGRVDEAERALDAAGAGLAQEHPDAAAFWRGRILNQRGRNLEAALEFMRLPILYPARDKGRTAEALWWAGQAMEAAKAPKDEVRKVYNEAAMRYPGTTGAERAKREIIRLGG